MAVPLKISDAKKVLTEPLKDHIRERVDKLSHFFGRVRRCHVMLDGPGDHPLPGRYRLRVSVSVPDSRIVVNRRSAETPAMAIRESFDAADQRLEDYARSVRTSSRNSKQRPSRKASQRTYLS
jgi:ribosome-associated translation inhibitor RaiA